MDTLVKVGKITTRSTNNERITTLRRELPKIAKKFTSATPPTFTDYTIKRVKESNEETRLVVAVRRKFTLVT